MLDEVETTTMTVSAVEAATLILFNLQEGQSVRAVKFIKNWCGCNLRTAVNMKEAFERMPGSNFTKVEKIAACLPLGKISEVVDVERT